jgi:predicted GNAT superfamily acetyltransferase
MPEARQNSSKLPDIFESASSFSALVGTTVDVVSLFMALLSFVESAPRAYRLKASNAASPISTSIGTIPKNAEHVVFLVAEHNGKAIGFLLGYNDVYASRRSGGQSEADIAARYSGPFYVLKQIALDLNEHHKGVGRALVDRFVAEARCTYIFSAVVSEPENPASSMFHRKMGFAPIFNSTSSNVNGVTYPNQVWRRTCSPV